MCDAAAICLCGSVLGAGAHVKELGWGSVCSDGQRGRRGRHWNYVTWIIWRWISGDRHLSGSLASVCRSRRRERGEKSEETLGEKPHLCSACFQMDMTDRQMDGPSFTFCCAVTTQHISPLLSCCPNDAELCRLLTSPLGWLKKEPWVLTVFLFIKERQPSTKAEFNRRDPSGLSGLTIDLLHTGGFGPSNKQCISFDKHEDLLGLWLLFSVSFSNLSNTIEHAGLDCPVFFVFEA